MDTLNMETKKSCRFKKLLFDFCILVIRKKLVNNKNLDKKADFIVLI